MQGKLDVLRPGPLADFAVRHVRTGRHVGGKQDGAKDVLLVACRKRHGVRVVSCNVRPVMSGTDGWQQIAVEDRQASIPDLAAFRIDFADWLATLERRDRRIVRALIAGDRTYEVAGRFGISEGRVSQLRRKYEHLWRTFQGESTGAAA